MGAILDCPKNLWQDKKNPSRQAHQTEKALEKKKEQSVIKMTEICTIHTRNGLAGILLTDDKGTKYASLHLAPDAKNSLATIARCLDSDDLFGPNKFHPAISVLPEPQPIPNDIRNIFAATYTKLGIKPLFVFNSDCAYILN